MHARTHTLTNKWALKWHRLSIQRLSNIRNKLLKRTHRCRIEKKNETQTVFVAERQRCCYSCYCCFVAKYQPTGYYSFLGSSAVVVVVVFKWWWIHNKIEENEKESSEERTTMRASVRESGKEWAKQMSKSTANDRPSDRPMPFEYVCQRVECYFTSIQRCAVLFDSLSRRSSVRQSIGRVYSVGPVYTQIHFDSLYNHIILYMSRTVCIHEHDYSIQFHSDTATQLF